jgi:hypothetical protein
LKKGSISIQPLQKGFVIHRMNHEALLLWRNKITAHPLYNRLQSLDDLRIFASHHVFAVWDFMSLLKSLQQQLTCTEVPWRPVGNASTRFLINEIVTGEESDVDPDGKRCSHFELYLAAMKEMGANTAAIEQLLHLLSQGVPVREALRQLELPSAILDVCKFTFDVIEHAPAHVQAAVFTYGREDLIPDMFHELVQQHKQQHPDKLNTFTYYLERHIEVDGDHHSHLAKEMVTNLCGADESKWEEARLFAERSLEMRYQLWEGVLRQLETIPAV